MLDKLKKRICKTLAASLAATLEPLAHRRNVASLSLFYRCYFAQLIFVSPFLDIIRMSMSTVSFLSQLDSLPT